MLELPEVVSRVRELNENIVGKTVKLVSPPSSPHKFCWFNGEAEKYNDVLTGKKVTAVNDVGIFIEIVFSDEKRLCYNDGVNLRLLLPGEKRPLKYQLIIEFEDGYAMIFTVAMYGGIICHNGEYDNEYYKAGKKSISIISDEFSYQYFKNILSSVKPSLSLKSFLATEQRFVGLGNGVLQDILFEARLRPRHKISELSEEDIKNIYKSMKTVLIDMTEYGGRDTEKDIFGNPGRYKTKLSKNTYKNGCSVCGSEITKETYLGGTVYYCPICQI